MVLVVNKLFHIDVEGSGVTSPGFKVLYYLFAVCLWTCYLTSLCLNSFCQIGKIKPLFS